MTLKRCKKIMFIVFVLLGLGTVNSQAAAITGKAVFTGQAPVAEALNVDADPNCKLMHAGGLTNDEVIINANGALKDVFIYVKEGLAGKTFESPKQAVTLDQKGCQYTPKVFGIQVNQPLQIINSDSTLHNVHALAEKNAPFNLGMPIQGMKLKKTFTKPEVLVKIKCEVHPWMHAYAGVVEHPYYSVSNDQGLFEIKDLPPGQYVLEAVHAKFGSSVQNVTIGEDSETKDIAFDFNAA